MVNDLALLVREDAVEGIDVTDGERRWEIAWPEDALPPPAGFTGVGDDGVVVILATAGEARFHMPESCGSG